MHSAYAHRKYPTAVSPKSLLSQQTARDKKRSSMPGWQQLEMLALEQSIKQSLEKMTCGFERIF